MSNVVHLKRVDDLEKDAILDLIRGKRSMIMVYSDDTDEINIFSNFMPPSVLELALMETARLQMQMDFLANTEL